MNVINLKEILIQQNPHWQDDFVLESTVCNKCGKKFNNERIGNPITEIEINFGYGSKYDNQKWVFDLCDECIYELTNDFKIKPELDS